MAKAASGRVRLQCRARCRSARPWSACHAETDLTRPVGSSEEIEIEGSQRADAEEPAQHLRRPNGDHESPRASGGRHTTDSNRSRRISRPRLAPMARRMAISFCAAGRGPAGARRTFVDATARTSAAALRQATRLLAQASPALAMRMPRAGRTRTPGPRVVSRYATLRAGAPGRGHLGLRLTDRGSVDQPADEADDPAGTRSAPRSSDSRPRKIAAAIQTSFGVRPVRTPRTCSGTTPIDGEVGAVEAHGRTEHAPVRGESGPPEVVAQVGSPPDRVKAHRSSSAEKKRPAAGARRSTRNS